MTMRELAKLANVSVSTVSKAFLDADDVSDETKKHIFEIAKQYGCYGKYYKGKYSKKIVAIVCSELASNYYTRFVERLQKILDENDCIPIIATTQFSSSKQAELIEYFASYLKVDGIIVFGLNNRLKKGYTTPLVSVFSSSDPSVDTVNINFKSAIFETVNLLTKYGHKKIAFLGETLTVGKSKIFKSAMDMVGCNNSYIIESPYRFEKAGEDGVKKLLNSKTDCTAIICAYDNIAYGAMKELKKQNYRIPEDFSVIGIDNINTSQYTETSLSSMGVDPDEVCMIAWDLLSKKMKNRFFKSSQTITLQGELILRESVARLEK